MKKLKYLLAFILVGMVAGLLFLEKEYFPAESQVDGPPPFLRLHILANSDDEPDQKIKLKVRDQVLINLYPDFQRLNNNEEAVEYTKNNLDVIVNKINEYLDKHYCGYNAECAVVREYFTPSSYGILRLPGGEYWSLRVTLGEGQGRNWWCVLYPPLCFYDLNDGESLSVITHQETKTKTAEQEQTFLKSFYQDKILKVWITQ